MSSLINFFMVHQHQRSPINLSLILLAIHHQHSSIKLSLIIQVVHVFLQFMNRHTIRYLCWLLWEQALSVYHMGIKLLIQLEVENQCLYCLDCRNVQKLNKDWMWDLHFKGPLRYEQTQSLKSHWIMGFGWFMAKKRSGKYYGPLVIPH